MTSAPIPDRPAILEALRTVIDPELRRDVVDLKMVRDIVITPAGEVTVGIALTTPGCPLKDNISGQVERAVGALAGVTAVAVDFSFMNEQEKKALRTQLRGGVEQRKGISLPTATRVLAVASGKGGVGKSSIAAACAAELARRGLEVGVLDADVYGYSQPQMLGIQQRPVTVDQMIVPPVARDIRVMSIGFFLDDDQPIMWRGPMLHRALEQFLTDVHWGDLDWLVVDMPPGTGDIAISLGQLLPRAEVLVVTTPQVAAQTVAERAAAMARQLEQSVVGVVENMAGVPGGEPSPFGEGGGTVLAEHIGAPLLASIPLDAALRIAADGGAIATADLGACAEPIARVIDAVIAAPAPKGPPPAPADRIKKPLAMV